MKGRPGKHRKIAKALELSLPELFRKLSLLGQLTFTEISRKVVNFWTPSGRPGYPHRPDLKTVGTAQSSGKTDAHCGALVLRFCARVQACRGEWADPIRRNLLRYP
jgi:hypothetical protein